MKTKACLKEELSRILGGDAFLDFPSWLWDFSWRQLTEIMVLSGGNGGGNCGGNGEPKRTGRWHKNIGAISLKSGKV